MSVELSSLTTVLDHIRFAMSRFYQADVFLGHGTDSMWDEALALVLHALHLPLDMDPVVLQAKITPSEQENILMLLEKRIHDRLPAAYLTHQAPFAGLAFYVDERVLIPRSPLAEVIEHEFSPWIDPAAVSNILDLCTGSGCIAIACALIFPDAHVDAVDVSADALDVARINCEEHGVTEQVSLIQSDLLNEVPKKQYDIIISNPPYVSTEEMKTLPAEYHHEPVLGLHAEEAGLAFVHRILAKATDYLSDHGILIVEVGNSADALLEVYPEVPFTWLEFERGGDGVFLLKKRDLSKILSRTF